MSGVSPTPILHLRRAMAQPEDFENAVTGLTLTLDFLGNAAAPSAVEQIQSPHWGVDFGRADITARVRGSLPLGWTSFCIVRAGQSQWNGRAGKPGSLFCAPPGEELDGRIAPGFAWTTLAFPPELWSRCRSAAGGREGVLSHFFGWNLSPPLAARFESDLMAARLMFHAAAGDPVRLGTAAEFTRTVVAGIGSTAWELAGPGEAAEDTMRSRYRLARRAAAWMRDRMGDPIQVADVCLAMRVSRRELEYAFRQTFDQGPRGYLNALRLNAVRRALLHRSREGGTVAEVAMGHGILHLGRFSAEYHRLFGEPPSRTLRARQGGGILIPGGPCAIVPANGA